MTFQKKYFTDEEKRQAIRNNSKRWRERHPEEAKGFNAHLLRKLNKTEEDYVALRELQNGRCAICGRLSNNKHTDKLYWDHDHETNEPRGLLCSRCNSGLGFFSDNLELILKAAEYLNFYRK